ncbi:MAG: sugar phosphate isomerase/epimerase [Planctomycetota bacterium]|nr:MAG: sugar phosphate isomerase/epimerase [Planctomycetota bacterium]
MVRLGYNSNGFPHHRLEDALPWLAELGYRAVAITPDVPHLDPRYAAAAEVRRIGRLCAELDLAVVLESGARYLLDPRRKHRPNLLEPDDARDLRLKFLRHMVEWCDLLGARVLSFWSGVVPAGQSEAGARARLADGCANLAALAERYGVTLALEPEPGHLISTVDDWLGFRAEAPAGLRLCLDLGHLLVTGEREPAAALRELAGEIATVQLDDMRRGDHVHRAPGEGEIDFLSVAAALRDLPEDLCACWELSRDGHRFHELAPRLATLPPAP